MVFGGYSYHLKKALDRFICFALPFFHEVGGETHHLCRYDLDPRLVVIGHLPCRDEEAAKVFGEMVERNVRNLQTAGASSAAMLAGDGPEDVAAALREAFARAGVR